MVSKSFRKGLAIFYCEYCESGYSDLEVAEACEEFCCSNGRSSTKISQKALYRPIIRTMPLLASGTPDIDQVDSSRSPL